MDNNDPMSTSLDARAQRAGRAMSRLVRIMATLRSKHGCPWDRKQTHQSLRPFLLEETYEALEVLDRGDIDALPGEPVALRSVIETIYRRTS